MFHYWALACLVMQYDAVSRGKACNYLKARKSKVYFGLLDAPLGGAKYTRLYRVSKTTMRTLAKFHPCSTCYREREREREWHASHAFFPERKTTSRALFVEESEKR